ncbi:MAG: hypothetical protein ABI618_16690, partial [Nitrospirota bacterium]
SMELVASDISWINKNIYQPYFEPVVTDINQYIYQPYIAPLLGKASNWWEKYGEWVHGALDTVGFIPGLGEIADGLNGLIYLGEGRYLEAGISALSMIPIVGDLGKAGKWSLEIGKEVLEEATERVVKEVAEELVEKQWMHAALDIVGGIPGIGKVTDGLNSLIYLNKGRYLEAGISALSMIPVVGDFAKIGLKIGKEILGKSGEKLVKEIAEEVVEKVVKATVIVEMVEETLEQVSKEATQRVLKEVVEGKVTKLPMDMAGKLTDESANELAEKISKELGGKKVWISAKTNSIYVSSPPAEGFLLAEQLSKTDLTKTDEVEKILRRVAELTSRGSGNRVVLGPFGPTGTFIQEALDTNGVFWDVGDELWETLEKTGVDMFNANDQFLRVQIENGIERFDVIGTNVDKVIEKFNTGTPEPWGKISYTRKEILDLASMPDIPYQRVGNSWIRVDLT